MALNINGTTGISGVDGSASAPALQGTDSNTGINFGSDTVNINTGGLERMRIQSDGDVSFSNSANGAAQIKNVNGDQSSVNGGGFPQYAFVGNEGTGMRRPSENHLAFDTTGAERMRIDSSGNLQIGCTVEPQNGTAGVEIRPQGSIRMGVDDTGGNNVFEFNNPNGNVGKIVCSGSSTSYQTSSDYRLKENVVAISDGITRLKTLKPSRFNFIADAETTVDGFLAHEVTAVPEAISGTKDEVDADNNPIYQGIDQSKLVPLLTAALQEAVAKIEVLETKVAALEAG